MLNNVEKKNINIYLEVIQMQVATLICDILIVLISSFAIFQYLMNRRHKLKSAATIVYYQLKEFDEYIESVKGNFDQEGNISDYHLSLINSALESNAWGLNKHILVKSLSQDDIELINKTYSIMESIEDARKRVLDTFMTTNNSKSFALQFQVVKMLNDEKSVNDIRKLSDEFGKPLASFSAKIPHDIFKNMVSNYKKVLGTQTLEKLRKLSYKNKK